MKTKSIIAVLVAVVFILSFTSLSFAAGAEKAEKMAVKGEVTKIQDNKVTVKDDMGTETTVDVKDLKDIKVGDKVKIKDGVVKKMTGMHEESEMPEKSGY